MCFYRVYKKVIPRCVPAVVPTPPLTVYLDRFSVGVDVQVGH